MLNIQPHNNIKKRLYFLIEALVDIYLSLNRLKNPEKRWSLSDLEKEIDLDI